MRKYKDETITRRLLTKLVCDRCGVEEDIASLATAYVAEFTHSYGYGSKYDQYKLEFDLCEKCLDETLQEMKINFRRGPHGETMGETI